MRSRRLLRGFASSLALALQHREALIGVDQLLEEPLVAPIRDRVHHLELLPDPPGPATQSFLELADLARLGLVLDVLGSCEPLLDFGVAPRFCEAFRRACGTHFLLKTFFIPG